MISTALLYYLASDPARPIEVRRGAFAQLQALRAGKPITTGENR